MIWDENFVFLFYWEKKLFWTNKKFVYLIFIDKLLWYHPKITYKYTVQKDMNKFFAYLSIHFNIPSPTFPLLPK